MVLFQVLVPITLCLIGFSILFSGRRNQSKFLQENYLLTRKRLIEFGEKQEDKSEIKTRLNEIGENLVSSYGEFRYRQIMLSSTAILIPFIALFLMFIDLIQAIGLGLFLGVGTYLMYDRNLSNKVKERRELIESEFPAIIEMLTLAIAAGETPIVAFARIADRSDAFLAKEFAKVVHQVRNGRPFHEALDQMSRTLNSSSIRRFIDALVMALVRGAPVVEVLHRHVAEARINQRNLVMDKAGKAETTMMIPIVFLILPISVLFALWPSINQLSFFAG
jgi:tight adherence protein C